MKKTICFLIILVFFSSCSIQSRRYRNGFYIENNLGTSVNINADRNSKVIKTKSELNIKEILNLKASIDEMPISNQFISYSPKKKSKEVIERKIKASFTSKQQLKQIQMNKRKTIIKKIVTKKDNVLRKEAKFSVISGSISILIFWLPFVNVSLLFFVLISAMFSLIGCLAAYDVRKDVKATEEEKAIARWGRFLSILPMAIYLAILIYAVFSELLNLTIHTGVI